MSLHSNVYEAIATQVATLGVGLPEAQREELLDLANTAEEEVFGWVELWESSAEEAEVLALWAALVRERWPGPPQELVPLLAWAEGAQAEEERQAGLEWTAQDVAAAAPAAAKAVGGGVARVAGLALLVLGGLAWARR